MLYLSSFRFLSTISIGLVAYLVVAQYPQFGPTLELEFWQLIGKAISEVFDSTFRGWIYLIGGVVTLEAFWVFFITPSGMAPIRKHVFPMFVNFFGAVAAVISCGMLFVAIAGVILMWCEPKFLLGVGWVYGSMYMFSNLMAIHLRHLAKSQQYTSAGVAAKREAEKP